MSSHFHAIVWLDHQEAKIFQFDATDVDATAVRGTHPHQHLHHKADARDSGHAIDKAYLKHIADALASAGAILITGPANAKKELASYIERELPDLAKRVSGVETLDHPSDAALVAYARKYFKADDRMQPQAHRNS